MFDPVLFDAPSEEAACWQAAVEAEHAGALAFLDRARAIARGFVLASAAGRAEFAVLEVQTSLQVGARTAQAELVEALQLTGRPATCAALESGRLSVGKATVLLAELSGLAEDLAGQVEQYVLDRADARTAQQVRAMTRRRVLRLDPKGAQQRRRARLLQRSITVRAAGDGMAWVSLLMRAQDALAVLHRAELATRTDDHSGRTRDQRRLDWAVQQLTHDQPDQPDQPGQPGQPGGEPAAGRPGGRRRRPVQAIIHVPVCTALDVDDEPCELEQIGALDAEHGRALLAEAELRKACVDARTGEVLSVDAHVIRPVAARSRIHQLQQGGLSAAQAHAQAQAEAVRAALLTMVATTSYQQLDPEPGYRPSANLDRLIKIRDLHCDFPFCSTPSRACDSEHTRPYHQGGPTAASNLRPRSRFHHRAKQAGWTPHPGPGDTTTWISPTGRSTTSPAPHQPPPAYPKDTPLPPPRPPGPQHPPDPDHHHDDPDDTWLQQAQTELTEPPPPPPPPAQPPF